MAKQQPLRQNRKAQKEWMAVGRATVRWQQGVGWPTGQERRESSLEQKHCEAAFGYSLVTDRMQSQQIPAFHVLPDLWLVPHILA